MLLIRKLIYLMVVGLLMGHSLIPHHHHDEISDQDHHHGQQHNNDKGHNTIFSFARIDDSFIPAKIQTNIGCEYDLTSLVFSAHEIDFRSITLKSLPENSFKNEFPPPDNFIHSTFFRGPPTI